MGVYDTDEGALPSGERIFMNILKNRADGTGEWWRHSHHGVMGDGPVRVACFKQGLGSVYSWAEGADAPERFDPLVLAGRPEPARPEETGEGKVPYSDPAWAAYWAEMDKRYQYGSFGFTHDFGSGEYAFTFTDAEASESGHYEATMTEPDGTGWRCVYDYEYGAGFEEDVPDGKREVFSRVVEAAFGEEGSSGDGDEG